MRLQRTGARAPFDKARPHPDVGSADGAAAQLRLAPAAEARYVMRTRQSGATPTLRVLSLSSPVGYRSAGSHNSESAVRETEINRRDFVSGLASAGTSAWLARHGAKLHTVAAYAASVSSEQPFDFFTPDQARDFDAISAQIIPSDDTPGAREAHVVRFADRYLATVAKDAQSGMRDNFKIVGDALAKKSSGSRSFAALSNEDQIAFLKELEKTHTMPSASFATSQCWGCSRTRFMAETSTRQVGN